MATRDELRAAEAAITEALAQHNSYTHRLSSGVVNQIHGDLDTIARRLWSDLGELLEALTPAELQAFTAGRYTTPALRELRGAINNAAKMMDDAIQSTFAATGVQLAGYEAAYSAALIAEVFEELPNLRIDPEQLFKAAMDRPMAGGQLVNDMLAKMPENAKDRFFASIRQGIVEGKNNDQIIRELRGTKALNYEDGLLQATKVETERMVRTARNHIGSTVYEDTYKALGAPYMIHSASLEGKTCQRCGALDGKVYKTEEPKPALPLHYNCRCQYVPSWDGELMGERPFMRALKVKKRDGANRFRSLGDMTKNQREKAGLEVGQVPASTTYSAWFKRQDAEFQKQWLGESRYKLYRDGKYDLARFIDPQGKQYTLDQLKARDAETFNQVFGK